MRMSCIELYNEDLRDLLDASVTLRIVEGRIENAMQQQISSVEEFRTSYAVAMRARTVGSTGLNARSSRSHVLVQLFLGATGMPVGPALSLVDLAGSERLAKTGA